MNKKLLVALKLLFVACLLVAYIQYMFLPSVRRFRERVVTVEVTMLPKANRGRPILVNLTAPAVTLCPFKNVM